MSASSRLDAATTWGTIRVQARNGGLTRCELPPLARQPARPLRMIACSLQGTSSVDNHVLRQAEKFIRACLLGKHPPSVPRLRLAVPTVFTRRVLTELRRIPRGTTRCYGAIARRLGAPRAARAVGRACGANPLALFIPCHRVLAADGALGGFSAGLAWKQFLLAQERGRC